ncbi:uncharacterized protein LOC126469854 isoform X3 [Schistocerca serialis cubense]|uniref:uncharacterized protein LOC126469854 isoform X3 n=1 Tax=Schistocerca serialis cubense TaxID=2023355 RepID=UPI00214E1669|nr:uncharacterized protein LOC126469854 isoform X3 [Schistocerca serialis cubense]
MGSKVKSNGYSVVPRMLSHCAEKEKLKYAKKLNETANEEGAVSSDQIVFVSSQLMPVTVKPHDGAKLPGKVGKKATKIMNAKERCAVKGGESMSTVSKESLKHLTELYKETCKRYEDYIRNLMEFCEEAEIEEINRQKTIENLKTLLEARPMADHSPAELLHVRQPRTLLHLLRPSTSRPWVPLLGWFTAGDLVWVRGYGRRPKWSPGRILRHRGQCLYEIQTNTGVAVRHSDQLQPRVPAMPVPDAATPSSALPDARDLGISHYSQSSPLTIISVPAQERTPPGDVSMQEPDDHHLSEQLYSPPSPTDADASPMSPVITTALAATGRLVHGAPADSSPTSPVISTRYHWGHFHPYGKPPPRDFTASQTTPMDVSNLQATSIKTSAKIQRREKCCDSLIFQSAVAQLCTSSTCGAVCQPCRSRAT